MSGIAVEVSDEPYVPGEDGVVPLGPDEQFLEGATEGGSPTLEDVPVKPAE